MIPRPYIAAWQEYAPWKSFSQVEQDLVISRTLVILRNLVILRLAVMEQKRFIDLLLNTKTYGYASN
mgnify:CR=1 FL=1